MSEKKYYWSPSIFWDITEEGCLRIENTKFQDDLATLFPRFYFVTGQGCTIDEIEQIFSEYPPRKLKKFLKLLIKENILICEVQEPTDLFYGQAKMFLQGNEVQESLLYDKEKLGQFVHMQITRNRFENQQRINLLATDEEWEVHESRRSIRRFEMDKKIGFSDFSAVLQVLAQRQLKGMIYYSYPSAGGLYPIDVYIYCKAGRVQNVEQGMYYYDPTRHQLALISTDELPVSVHYFTNQEIYRTSACSVFFVYHAASNMPKYGDRGYFYGMIDAGILAEAMTQQIERLGLGSCIIGDMEFPQATLFLHLDENERLLFGMEFGEKKEDM